jgi:predicted DCC family thiol-disulfide oxidoreductase YuxK
MTMHLHLYSTSHCHLCEQAEKILVDLALSHDLSWAVMEIADDANLLSRYELSIPVLARLDTGQKIAWPFNKDTVLDLIN